MLQLDVLNLIPQSLKQKALDTLVDFVSGQAKKYASDELGRRIKKLRSDAAFNQAFEDGLKQASRRFIEDYEAEDEDLVAAIAADETFFENEDVQAALLSILKQPGAYLTDEQETLLQSFDTVLSQRKNRQRVDRAVTYLLKCLAEELWHMPELQPIYSLQFQRVTAEATREQVDIQKAQLQALTTMNVGLREALLQLTDAIAEQKLLPAGDTAALPVPPPEPKVYHNLPQPDYGRFVGREAELGKVYRILRPYPHSQEHLVTIDGIGGIGKSALALEIAHRYLRNYDQIPPEERFEAIVWTSAKQTVLTAEGIAPRRQVLSTLNDIYVAIAVALQREDITRALPEEQDEVVRNALTRQRSLLIVDNLETVDDEAVIGFLRELPAPTKAIVTIRHQIDIASSRSVRLGRMPWEDAQELIAKECKKKNVTLTNNEPRRLYDSTSGMPLSIVWSVAQMGFGYGVEAVLTRLGQPTSDIAHFCFDGAMEHIRDKPTHKLLMALSLFATDASREALGYVTDLPELDRDDGLVGLEKLSLVIRIQNGRFQMLPLTKEYTATDSLSDPITNTHFRNRQVEYYLTSIPYPSSFPIYTEEIVNLVKTELQNILDLLEWCEGQAKEDFLLKLFLNIHDLLGVFGNLNIRVKWALHAIQAAKVVGTAADLGRLYATMGWIDMKRGELDQAHQWLDQALQVIEQSDASELKCVALRFLGRLEGIKGNVKDAQEIRQTALALAKSKGFTGVVSGLNSDLAYWEMNRRNFDKAEEYIREAISGFEDLNDIVRASDRSVMLANILVRKGNYSEAEEVLIPVLNRIEVDLGQLEAIAAGYACLAHIRAQQGNISEAKGCCVRAKQIYDKMGMQEETFPIGLPTVCKE